VFAGTQALAQTVGVGPAETIVIETEQRTVIRDYVVKERVAPVRVNKERIAVGAPLPADVELRTVPPPGDQSYRNTDTSIRVNMCIWWSHRIVRSCKSSNNAVTRQEKSGGAKSVAVFDA
jgi:hypothetical protein